MFDVETLRAKLAETFGERVRARVPLAEHTSFRVGGPADLLVEVHTVGELAFLLEWAAREGVPCFLLGNGSNVLVRDGGVRGIVVKCRGRFLEARIAGSRVTAGAGVLLPSLAHLTAAHGLAGFEPFVGIPGTVGGGLAMNAGIPEAALGEVVERVRGLDTEGLPIERVRAELGFGYRSSRIQAEGWVVTEAVFALREEEPAACEARLKAFLKKRAGQPMGHPNAGCVFKNPSGGKESAGRLVDRAGAKGWMRGGIQVSPLHGNFFVNLGHGTAQDALGLIEDVRARVREATGVALDLEVKVIGDGA